ncbi:ionotropic receptor 75a [Halyomorpha halys]|uniref:ionotropic receptor 75a n=1 Tax=Halyomorpha halys TaxID=286706 RepID=UPI0034D2C121
MLGQIHTIIDYFKALKISSLSLLLCLSEEMKILALRQFSQEGFQISFGFSSDSRGTVLDLNCNNQTGGRMDGEWLVLGKAVDTTELRALPDSKVTLLTEEGVLMDIYRPTMSSLLSFANYTGQRDHSDLKGETLKAVTVEDEGTSVRLEEGGDLFGKYGCLCKNARGWSPQMSEVLVDNLKQQLNFKVKRKKVTDCNALYSTLSEGVVDFSSTAIMILPEKMEYSSFTGDLFEYKSMILFKHPRLPVMKNIYVLPFHRYVWFCCVGLFFLCFGLLLAAARSYPGVFEEYTYSSPSDILTLLIGVASQQGIDLGARSPSTRMALLLFSVCSLFLSTSYSANIVALIQSGAETITTIADLVQSPLSFAVQDVSFVKVYLKNGEKEVKDLYETKIMKGNSNPFISAERGVEKMKNEVFAFHVETSIAYNIMSKTYTSQEKCGLSELHVYTYPRFSIPVIKDSGYRDLFASRLSRQRECGLIKRAELLALERKPACTAKDSGFVSVTFGDFLPGLLVLCWGMVAAVIALFAEITMSKCTLLAKQEKKKEK